ncbi:MULTISPECIES: hypothetical protein [Okeania]|uniref:hypothetical protein n=1 Tax=Okeania TaxID=1458928 RepID=UPI001864CF98|nr:MULTISPECIES: hypothetical protein [Okeania]
MSVFNSGIDLSSKLKFINQPSVSLVSETCLIWVSSGIALWVMTLIKPILGIKIYNHLPLIDENFNQESLELLKVQ